MLLFTTMTKKTFNRLEDSYVIGNVFDNPDLLEILEGRAKNAKEINNEH